VTGLSTIGARLLVFSLLGQGEATGNGSLEVRLISPSIWSIYNPGDRKKFKLPLLAYRGSLIRDGYASPAQLHFQRSQVPVGTRPQQVASYADASHF